MRAHRTRHRITWLLLAPLLTLGVALGLALRPGKPIEPAHPAGEHPGREPAATPDRDQPSEAQR